MIKKYKPTSPGRRHRIVVKDTTITKSPSLNLKYLKTRKARTGGRNNSGKITMRYRGGGHKKLLREIDWSYKKGMYCTSTIEQIEYCPQTKGNIVLCATPTKDYFYRIATKGLEVGQTFTGPYDVAEIPQEGDVKFLKDIPQGRHIHSIEIQPGQGATLARSAGSFATLLSHLPNGSSIVLLPSKQTVTLKSTCLGTLGQVGNERHFMKKKGKAGASRWEGRRPRTRGEAMNAVDHPHGGKSHSSGGKGKPIKNIWGKLAKFTR